MNAVHHSHAPNMLGTHHAATFKENNVFGMRTPGHGKAAAKRGRQCSRLLVILFVADRSCVQACRAGRLPACEAARVCNE